MPVPRAAAFVPVLRLRGVLLVAEGPSMEGGRRGALPMRADATAAAAAVALDTARVVSTVGSAECEEEGTSAAWERRSGLNDEADGKQESLMVAEEDVPETSGTGAKVPTSAWPGEGMDEAETELEVSVEASAGLVVDANGIEEVGTQGTGLCGTSGEMRVVTRNVWLM